MPHDTIMPKDTKTFLHFSPQLEEGSCFSGITKQDYFNERQNKLLILCLTVSLKWAQVLKRDSLVSVTVTKLNHIKSNHLN